jgi:ribosomal protein S18 acetylase RimI-like enzyme
MTYKLLQYISDLPAGVTARPTLADDAEICTQIVRAVDIAACGETTTTVEELLADITLPSIVKTEGTVVFEKSGTVVALLNCFNEAADGRGVFFDFFVHPALDESLADAISLVAVQASEKYAQSCASEANLDELTAKTALYEADRNFLGALKARNFEYHRTFWRMKRDVTDSMEIKIPEGYELSNFIPSDSGYLEIHAVNDAAFADYYDFHPLAHETWLEHVTTGVNDVSLWRVITFNGAIVGYLMGNKRFYSEGYGYVASLAVVREHRSHGLAKALLADAFNRDAHLGHKGTILHGDSSNPTGAMKLYESVGMKTDRIYLAYRKVIKKH